MRIARSAGELIGDGVGIREAPEETANASGGSSNACGTSSDESCASPAEYGFRSVLTESACPGLRAVCLHKWGTELYLFSNEGQETIRTEVSIPRRTGLVFVDLWSGKTEKKSVRLTERGTTFSLFLPPCHVLLAAADGEAADWDKACGAEAFWPEDWTGLESVTETGRCLASGEEMAECLCNGKEAGVSFFGPHLFEIGSFLQEGENEVRLSFTGSAANQYENAGLFFGLEEG